MMHDKLSCHKRNKTLAVDVLLQENNQRGRGVMK